MFSKDQYCFRSGMSTSLAVYDMHENLLQSAKDGLTTCAVVCDLSKAFDTIEQGFPTFFLPCIPSAFRQMSMYPYSISTDKDVPLQNFDR